MKEPCRHHEETLMLDALGELHDSRRRRELESHLETCEGCRSERARLQRWVGGVRAAAKAPELTASQADAMANAVVWRLRNERLANPPESGWRRRWVPALAAGCALLVVAVFGYRFADRWFEPEAGLEMAAGLQEKDLDVIKNLDFLKEMDTIDKLIHVVDLPANGQSPDQAVPDTQGMRGHDTARVYV